MPTNILFDFIRTSTPSPEVPRATYRVSREEHAYYLFDLEPIAAGYTLTKDKHTYTLKSHHISVYEMEDRARPELSQYHYTANFDDESGAQYKLHVFFNYNDKIVGRLDFTQVDDPDRTVHVSVEEFEDQLIDLATSHSRSVVGLLRTEISKEIQKKIREYNRLELQACELSKSAEHLDAYIENAQRNLLSIKTTNKPAYT